MSEREYSGNANLPIGDVAKDGKKNANQEIGVPGGISGGVPRVGPAWHSRGYLPHFDSQEAVQHVTFHLADSLPKEVVNRMEAELKLLPENRRDVERRKRIEAWIDAGHGSCVLRDPVVAAMVQDALLFFNGQRYTVFAWVVMPNHVHVLFQPLNGWTVAKIVASWKKFTARKICEHRRKAAAGNAHLLISVSPSANQEIGVPGVESAAGNANLLIGAGGNANQEMGVPGTGQEIGVPGDEPVWHREYSGSLHAR